jgi:hypothetical protein
MACGAPASEWKEKAFEIDQDVELGQSTNAFAALIYMVLWFIAIYSRPSVRLRIPWCAAHRQYWLWRGLIYRSCLLCGVILFFAVLGLFNATGMALFWCVVVVLLCGAWLGGVLVLHRSSIRTVKVTADSVTLIGVASPFREAAAGQLQPSAPPSTTPPTPRS